MVTGSNCNFKLKETERLLYLKSTREQESDEKVSLLYSSWSEVLNKSTTEGNGDLERKFGIRGSNLPNAPHLENCKLKTQLYRDFDKRIGNERFPPWTSWKGFLQTIPVVPNEHIQNPKHDEAVSEGAYPPWVCLLTIKLDFSIFLNRTLTMLMIKKQIDLKYKLLQIVGSDEDNYPLTRKVQRDIWIHQHPLNCSDPNVKFLVADWERLPGFGIGAQMASMCGLLSIAINEGRVLVTNHYNRADHDGCKGI
jgi:hypothetical protein